MMHRRFFLRGLGAALGMALLPPVSTVFSKHAFARQNSTPALPILMFHKVDDSPRYPEDISTDQLLTLFDYLWKQGFYPVNMSDILTSQVDALVPRGKKPVGITADDAHRSVVFSQNTAPHAEQRNARSLVDILCASAKNAGLEARATLFLSCVGDDRISREPEGYFGNTRPLGDILAMLADTPGIETGFHTVPHVRMTNMDGPQVRSLMEQQIADFSRRGVGAKALRILAYPYGIRPSDAGIAALKDMGFLGAVLAFPGNDEAAYTTVPACLYDGSLKTDPFLVPRVCVGARTYSRKGAVHPYQPIDPLEDFRKDVENALPLLYTSTGKIG